MRDTQKIAIDAEMRVGKEWRAVHITVQPGSLQLGSCYGMSIPIVPTWRRGLLSDIVDIAQLWLRRSVTCHVDGFQVNEHGAAATITPNWPDDAIQLRTQEQITPGLSDAKKLWMATDRK